MRLSVPDSFGTGAGTSGTVSMRATARCKRVNFPSMVATERDMPFTTLSMR